MIRLEKIEKIYQEKNIETKALRGVNLCIERGEFVAIVGTSGSGKTTLLNILGAMSHPTSGNYFYEDIEVTKLSQNKFHQFRKDNVSFVFQNFELMERYTVFENIEMPLLARGIKRRKEKVEQYLEILGIKDLSKKLPNSLSGGQKQRCAIARALVTEANLILADEPTGALDVKTTDSILRVFEEIHNIGRTIVLITHDLNVANHCNRILRIEDGMLFDDKEFGNNRIE